AAGTPSQSLRATPQHSSIGHSKRPSMLFRNMRRGKELPGTPQIAQIGARSPQGRALETIPPIEQQQITMDREEIRSDLKQLESERELQDQFARESTKRSASSQPFASTATACRAPGRSRCPTASTSVASVPPTVRPPATHSACPATRACSAPRCGWST
ncbi:MAG: hypothetical protein WCK28_13265, partial [Burkholderiales bacterium]